MALAQNIALEHLLTRVAEYHASDLHLTVGSPPVLRVDSALTPLQEEPVVTPDFMETVLEQLLSEEQRAELTERRSIVFTYAFGNKARFKANVFYQKGYPSASLRYIAPRVLTLAELKLPDAVYRFTKLNRGLVIIAGPFGSGRSATVAALIDTINRERSEHILTIERPIEYLFENQQSIVEQREVGRDTPSFAEAIENSFQEDANVIMLSELETQDVIESALKIADAGRLVVSTMSTDTAVRTLEKIITSFPPDRQEQISVQLSEVLEGIVAQRLLPKTGGGSVAVTEVLLVSPAIRAVIRDGALAQIPTILQTSRGEGMMTLDTALAEAVKRGDISTEEALRHATDKETLQLQLRTATGY